jgi:hypothetical protein
MATLTPEIIARGVQECKYCGHKYWTPCIESMADACPNVKLVDGKRPVLKASRVMPTPRVTRVESTPRVMRRKK